MSYQGICKSLFFAILLLPGIGVAFQSQALAGAYGNDEQTLFVEIAQRGYDAESMIEELQELISDSISRADAAYAGPVAIGYTAFRQYYSTTGSSAVEAMRAINRLNTISQLCRLSVFENSRLASGKPQDIALVAGLQLALQVTMNDCNKHKWKGY